MMPDPSKPNDAQDPSVPLQLNGIEFEIPTELLQAIENITPFNLNLEPLHFNIDEWTQNLEPITRTLESVSLSSYSFNSVNRNPIKLELFHTLQTHPNEEIENRQIFLTHIWLSIFTMLSIKDLAHLMLTCKSIANLMAADEGTQKRFYDSKFSIFHPKPSERLLDHFQFNDLAPLTMRLQMPTVVDETNIYEQPGDGTNGFTFRKT